MTLNSNIMQPSHYGSFPPICPIWASELKKKALEKNKIGVNIPSGRVVGVPYFSVLKIKVHS